MRSSIWTLRSIGWRTGHRDLEKGDTISWLGVATQVHERIHGLAPGEFRRWLDETVGELARKQTEVLSALGSLGVPMATTNYDNLLEEVLGRERVTWKDPAGVQRVLPGRG